MKDRIPDAKIKELIRNYKGGNEESYISIVKMLSLYTYNYPRIVFSSDLDVCGDFYEYILVRLKDILVAYKESEVRFVTWFTVVLRNSYLNFVREKKSKYLMKEPLDFLSFDFQTEKSQSLYNVVSDKKDYMSSNKKLYDALIDDIIKNLKDRQRIFFHLYYIDTLRPEDIGFLSIFLEQSVRDILVGIDRIKNSMIERYEIKNILLQRLNILFYNIVRFQKAGNELEALKLKKKRDKVLEEYRRVKLNPSYKSLSQFLKLPLGTVSTGILRMKNSVKQYLKEYHYEEMPVS